MTRACNYVELSWCAKKDASYDMHGIGYVRTYAPN